MTTLAEVNALAKQKVEGLTLEEKIAFLCANHPAVERLGYPAYRLEAEGAHGLVIRDGMSFMAHDAETTVFPGTFGLSMTWDRELLREIGEVISDEARAFNALVIFSPTIDLARDPRWGRNEEAYGEDPFLAGQLGVEYIRGLQGDEFPYLKTAATVKHFYANNYEFERDWDNSIVPEKLKRDHYLRPFEYAFKEANATSAMTGYNMINGVIGMMNPELNTILRDEWGADGYFVSDGKAPEILNEMYGVIGADDEVESLARYLAASLKAGMDCFLAYDDDEVIAAIKRGINLGIITEQMINQALTRQFSVMLRLGLIPGLPNNPYLTSAINNPRGIATPVHNTTKSGGNTTPRHSAQGADATPSQNLENETAHLVRHATAFTASRHSAGLPETDSAESIAPAPSRHSEPVLREVAVASHEVAQSAESQKLEHSIKESALLARRAAKEAIVLLKNDGILPLNPMQTRRIAVIGQLGNENMRDWYSGIPPYQITPLAGIKKEFPNSEVVFDDGCDLVSFYDNAKQAWLRVIDEGAIKIDGDEQTRTVFRAQDWGYGFAFQNELTDKYLTTTDPGELRADATEVWGWFTRQVFFLNKPNAYSQTWPPPITPESPSPHHSAARGGATTSPSVEEPQGCVSKPREQSSYPTGITGIPITDDANINNAKFSPMIPFGAPAKPFGAKREGKNQYLVLFDNGGVEKLNQTLNKLTVKVIDNGLERAAKTAKGADAAIVIMGNHSLIGARECVDRPSTALPARWGALFDAVASANPNVILQIIAGFQYAIGRQEQLARAVLFTTHGLQEVGTAIGQTLSGKNNPSAKLTQTWYADDFQFGSMSDYDITNSKLTYLYTNQKPLHEFGFGLSCTNFAYSDLTLIPTPDGVTATFTLTNKGQVPGTEIVQIYLVPSCTQPNGVELEHPQSDSADIDSVIPSFCASEAQSQDLESISGNQSAPIKQLVAFDRITLAHGESKQVTIPIRHRELSFWDESKKQFELAQGNLKFEVGASSADIRLSGTVTNKR